MKYNEIMHLHPQDEILQCEKCGLFTSYLEASRRIFNTNRCAKCNGALRVTQESRSRNRNVGDRHD